MVLALLDNATVASWQLRSGVGIAARHTDYRCRSAKCTADASSPDTLLLAAMEALKDKDAERARALLVEAREAYEQGDGGPNEEQAMLLAMVASRVDSALVPGVSKTARRPPPPTPEELQLRAAAKARGDKALMQTVSVFGDKSDAERFGKALALLEEARAGFRRAGSDVEREREGVMGNLYSAIRAEEERSQRVAKLVRMKRLLELTKQKKKAETLGLDLEFEEAAQVERPTVQVEPKPKQDDLADDILQSWRREGLGELDEEVDKLEQQIQDLEDTL